MGGTFDPIHHGHLVAANEVASQFLLDEVVFVPTGQPWQKSERVVTAGEDRYLMTVIATASNPASAEPTATSSTKPKYWRGLTRSNSGSAHGSMVPSTQRVSVSTMPARADTTRVNRHAPSPSPVGPNHTSTRDEPASTDATALPATSSIVGSAARMIRRSSNKASA